MQTLLTVVIADDAEVRDLNRDYRGIDAPTDVLSFSAMETAPSDVAFVVAGPDLPYLGDVIVSYGRTAAQAAEQGHSVEQELRLLVVHGVLHLLGRDHDTPQREAQMWAEQAAILAALQKMDDA
jgi:probable rRNA maturation factor